MWIVQVAGDPSDLSTLGQSLTGNDLNISHDGQGYVLKSDQFADDDDAATVREKAEELVAVLNGASRLALDSINPIGVGAVYRQREGGKRDIFVFPEPGVIRLRGFAPTIKLTHTDGTVEEFHPADPVKQWVGVASKQDTVANVLRILAGGVLDWVNLYRIVEIIESDVGGSDAIVDNGWATKTTMRLFKHTANSPGRWGLRLAMEPKRRNRQRIR